MKPRLDILPAAQQALWPHLAQVPSRFVLYGGTAIALRLGHRQSVDFDFFAHEPLVAAELDAIEWIRNATVIDEAKNSRTSLVSVGPSTVKVSWFGGIQFGRIGEPEPSNDGVIRLASLLDLAGTKIKVLLQRVEPKDYRDIDALLTAGISLPEILGAGRALFASSFNPLVARKTMTYFDDADLASLERPLRERLLAAASGALEVADLSLREARLD